MDCTANPGGQLEINVQKTKKLGKHFVLGHTSHGRNHGLALEDTLSSSAGWSKEDR
jgi:hypothetical protein